MAVGVRSGSSAQSSSATTLSVTKPAGTASGDVLLCIGWQDSDGYPSQASLTPPAGWTQVGSTIATSGTSTWGKVWSKVAGGSEPTSYAFNTVSGSAVVLLMVALTGADTTTPIRVNPTAGTGTGTSQTAPSIAAGAGQDVGDLLVCSFSQQGGTNSYTPPSGMTEQVDITSSWTSGCLDTLALSGTAATGTKTATATLTQGDNYRTLSMVVAAISAPAQTVTPTGIASGQAFGTATIGAVIAVSPTGIPSGEAFGTALINDGRVRPAGIASAEAFGTATVVPGAVTLSPTGITSGEVFGGPKITVTFDLSKLDRRVRQAAGFELLAVARVPQPSGPPMLLTIDPIPWKGLAWVDELSKPQQLNASVSVNVLTDNIIQRLRKLHELPTELWLYRNGRLVFAGPWIGWQIQGDTLTMNAAGLLAYLKYMYVTSDLVYANVDQFGIVKGLVDHWQNQPYGNFGIGTGNIGSSGMVRDATYKKTELHNIGQRVDELGKRENGFDIEVDPTTRELKLWYPKQGADRSTGEDAVVFDKLTVTSSNVSCSAAPGDVASDAYGTGTGTGDPVYSAYSDPELLAKFGKAGVTDAFDGVSEQATLDDHVKGLQLARNAALLIPAPGLRSIPDVDLSAYNVGDTVAYQLHARLGIEGAFRLRKRTVTVSDSGVEKSDPEFV